MLLRATSESASSSPTWRIVPLKRERLAIGEGMAYLCNDRFLDACSRHGFGGERS